MSNKLLIGIIVVLIGLLIAGTVLFGSGLTLFGESNVYQFAIWIPLALWIFFVWMVWGKKLLYDQMHSELSKRSSIWLRTFLLLGGISYALWWIGIFLGHPRLGWTVFSEENPLLYIVGLLCAVGSIGFLVLSIRYIIRRQKTT